MAAQNSGISRANQNRKIRQEALREQLAAGGHVEHVLDMATKLADLESDLDSAKAQRLKYAIDAKLKLIDKYLPSLKATELTGDGGEGPVNLSVLFGNR